MKKAKIMLSAVLLMAVVGGVLAFKAKATRYCYYSSWAPGINCPLQGLRSVDAFSSTLDTEVPYKSLLEPTAEACPIEAVCTTRYILEIEQ